MEQSSFSGPGSSPSNAIGGTDGFRGVNNTLEGSWASKLLASNNVMQEGWKLKPYSPSEQILDIPEENILDVNDWGFCLVGFFVGPFPGMAAVDRLCKSWNVPFEFISHKSGWIIFKFKNSIDRASVMEKGPFNVYGRPLLLKLLPDFFLFEEDLFNKIPLWIQLSEIPIECWTPSILSMISSYVGSPICTDGTTSKLQRLSYARILVEVDITKPLVRNVTIRLPNGVVTEVSVTYEYEPNFCSKCKAIGHSVSNCKNGSNVGSGAVAGPAPNPIAGPKKWKRRSVSAMKDKGKQVSNENVQPVEQPVQAVNKNVRERSKSRSNYPDRKSPPPRGRSKKPAMFRDFISDIDSGKDDAADEPNENQAFTMVKNKKNRKRGKGGGVLIPNPQ